MEIFFASADLKLVPGARDYRLVELNNGNYSAFKGFTLSGQGDMMADRVMPAYRDLFPGYDVRLRDDRVVNPSAPAIVMPRSLEGGYYASRKELTTSKKSFVRPNASLRFSAVCDNKALQYLVAHDHPSTRDLFPPSVMVATDPVLNTSGLELPGDAERVVIKPVSMAQGNGVQVMPRDRARETIGDLIKGRHHLLYEGWEGLDEPVALVQAAVGPNLVPGTEGGRDTLYDGTMRVVFTVYRRSPDEDLACCVHGSYWKLPSRSYTGTGRQQEFISHSPAKEDDDPEHNLASVSAYFMRRAGWESLAVPVPPRILAARVDDAVVDWLYPRIERDMIGFVTSAVSRPLSARMADLCADPRPASRLLGVMMGFHGPPCYPENDCDDNGRDIVIDAYPAPVLRLGLDTITSLNLGGGWSPYFQDVAARLSGTRCDERGVPVGRTLQQHVGTLARQRFLNAAFGWAMT